LDKIVIEKINYEISQVDELFNSCKPLLDLCRLRKLDMIETMAAGSFLHSMYNGIHQCSQVKTASSILARGSLKPPISPQRILI